MIQSKGETLFQTRPDQEKGLIGPTSLLHSWHWVLFHLFFVFLCPCLCNYFVFVFYSVFVLSLLMVKLGRKQNFVGFIESWLPECGFFEDIVKNKIHGEGDAIAWFEALTIFSKVRVLNLYFFFKTKAQVHFSNWLGCAAVRWFAISNPGLRLAPSTQLSTTLRKEWINKVKLVFKKWEIARNR